MRRAAQFANIAILGVITALGLLLLYELFDYQDRLTGPVPAIGYYVLPLSALSWFIFSLRFRDSLKVSMVGLLGLAALSVYGIEAGVTFLPAASDAMKPLDTRVELHDKLPEVERLKQAGSEAWPSLHPRMLLYANYKTETQGREIFPLGGISNVITVYCAETEDYTIFESDEYGFHNPKGLYQPETLDIAVIGDSFAQGACVPSERNAVALIRNSYSNILNLGSGGNGPLLELASLKEFAAPLKPRIVLWFYFENDLVNLEREKKHRILLNYLKKEYHQNLVSLQPEIDQSLKQFIAQAHMKTKEHDTGEKLLRFLLLTHVRSRLGLHFFADSDQDDQVDLALFEQILISAQETIHSWEGQLYFVYLPAWERFGHPDRAEPHRDQVLMIVNRLGIPVIDIEPTFATHPDPLVFFPLRRSGHYNEAGYQAVAETILRVLQEENQLLSSQTSSTQPSLSGGPGDQD